MATGLVSACSHLLPSFRAVHLSSVAVAFSEPSGKHTLYHSLL